MNDNWLNAYKISKWLLYMGITPIIYVFTITQLFMFIGILLQAVFHNLNDFINTHYSILTFLGFLGLFITLYFVHKKLKQSNENIDVSNSRTQIGIIFMFIGHIGMLLFYGLLIYEAVILNTNSSASIIYTIPLFLWMGVFYMIGNILISVLKTTINRKDTIKESNKYEETNNLP